MNIAMIAHDKKKENIVMLAIAYQQVLKNHKIFATGTTGKLISEATGLDIIRFKSGPLGGPHEPDVTALLRLCDVHNIPLATNLASGEIMMMALSRGDLDWRNAIKNS